MRTKMREWRKLAGLTQQQVGERLDPPLTAQSVQKWEYGHRSPDPVYWEQLARMFDVPVDEFYKIAHDVSRQGESMTKSAVAVVERQDAVPATQGGNSTMGMVARLVDKAIDLGNPELVDKAIDWARQIDKEQARKAFHEDFARFFEECPVLYKDTLVSHETRTGGNKSYRHATLGGQLDKIRGVLGKYGFSLSWETSQENGNVSVTGTLTHRMGHFRTATLAAPPDPSGNKNPLQAIGSTTTYLRRYTMEQLLGLSAKEEDDDGQSFGNGSNGASGLINEDEANELYSAIDELGLDRGAFLRPLGVEAVEDIPAAKLQIARNALAQKRGRKK